MMLSRFAENSFWMGRYIERADNIARLLSVTEAFAADQESEAAWTPVLNVFSDHESYKSYNKPLTALNVAKFYLGEIQNFNSAAYSVHMAKENARTLRHLISTECWRQLSMFQARMHALSKRNFALSKVSEICDDIQHSCFTHRGIVETTWYRDEVWRFNRIGAALERADQMTRLLDMKYFEYDRDDDDQVAPPDVAWWNTLLRTASGYHAFQRRYSFDPQPADAAGFLLFDARLPLSVRAAVNSAFHHLSKLEQDYGAQADANIKSAAEALDNRLNTPPDRVNGRPLHRYLDQIQIELITLANALNERYFSPEQ
ncbi:MAG: hypothetical protein DHS20C05_02440 [Hyphococcus sp.]|nr:MAG: hypothetical protein DHS20C05_02440 [Marinicaulis sp.]